MINNYFDFMMELEHQKILKMMEVEKCVKDCVTAEKTKEFSQEPR